jgi:hypothetical protein
MKKRWKEEEEMGKRKEHTLGLGGFLNLISGAK